MKICGATPEQRRRIGLPKYGGISGALHFAGFIPILAKQGFAAAESSWRLKAGIELSARQHLELSSLHYPTYGNFGVRVDLYKAVEVSSRS